MSIQQQILLYTELKASLEDSFNAFVEYQCVALPLWQESHPFQFAREVGAMSFPGWREYIETVALPLNRKTFAIIQRLNALYPLPYQLNPFINYHTLFEARYAEWQRGENPNYEFTSGFWCLGRFHGINFPNSVERFVEKRLEELIIHRATLIEAQQPEVQPQEKKPMARTVGSIAFIAGLGVGIAAAIFAERLLPEPEPTSPWLTDTDVDLDSDNVTIEEINDAGDESSAALIDSLQGITVSGTDAVLLKVRVLDVERAKAVAMWGSKGVGGDESTVFRRLADLSTEHLINIRDNSTRATDDEKLIIRSILEDRVASGAADENVLN